MPMFRREQDLIDENRRFVDAAVSDHDYLVGGGFLDANILMAYGHASTGRFRMTADFSDIARVSEGVSFPSKVGVVLT